MFITYYSVVQVVLSYKSLSNDKTKGYVFFTRHISATKCTSNNVVVQWCGWSNQALLLTMPWPWVVVGWGQVVSFTHGWLWDSNGPACVSLCSLSVCASLTADLPLQLFCSSVICKPHCSALHPVTSPFLSSPFRTISILARFTHLPHTLSCTLACCFSPFFSLFLFPPVFFFKIALIPSLHALLAFNH